MDRTIDNAIEWLEGDDTAYVTLSVSKRMRHKIERLKEKYPLRVTTTENSDGSFYASIPIEWVKISPPRVLGLTEAERAERAERLRNNLDNSRSAERL